MKNEKFNRKNILKQELERFLYYSRFSSIFKVYSYDFCAFCLQIEKLILSEDRENILLAINLIKNYYKELKKDYEQQGVY